MSQPLLFTPLALGSLTLKNRVVTAPMHQYAGVEGFATDWHLMNAGRYAAGGAGLVMMESTKVERRGCGTVGDLGLWDDRFVPALARCADFVHCCGAAAGIQLGHSGRKSRIQRPWEGGKPLQKSDGIADWDAWELVAPSAIAFDAASAVPRALERLFRRELRFARRRLLEDDEELPLERAPRPGGPPPQALRDLVGDVLDRDVHGHPATSKTDPL